MSSFIALQPAAKTAKGVRNPFQQEQRRHRRPSEKAARYKASMPVQAQMREEAPRSLPRQAQRCL